MAPGEPDNLVPSRPARPAAVSGSTNPYQAPPDDSPAERQPDSPTERLSDSYDFRTAEDIRKEHFNHEASARLVGVLYYLIATLLAIIGIPFTMLSLIKSNPPMTAFNLLFIVIAAFSVFCGYSLRRLDPRTRTLVGIIAFVLAAIGLAITLSSGYTLLSEPRTRNTIMIAVTVFVLITTLISGYTPCLLFSPKGSMVFSSEYQVIIGMTSHMQCRTSPVVWVFFGLSVFALGSYILCMLAAFFW
ncbi:MAG: hypothetical protein JW818_14070 [Pirellulales bacterium]|nr:hypothetical protein [Pirellulales bacterium]